MTEDVKIQFGAGLTPGERELVEQSVASIVECKRAELEAARARSVEENKLLDAIAAPIAKLIHADSAAQEGLEKLKFFQSEPPSRLQSGPGFNSGHEFTMPTFPADTVERRRPPYDFAWNWHQGGAPFTQTVDQASLLGLDARAGNIHGGVDRFVAAHIGVGWVIRLDRTTNVQMYAPQSLRHAYFVSARGINASATAEGGLEMALMKGNEVQTRSTLPLWRRRVSGPSEHARDDTPFTNAVDPLGGMGMRCQAGEYAFVVGITAFADYSSGIGSAAVQSIMQSDILEMRISKHVV